MDNKNVRPAILLVSGVLIIWVSFLLIKHLCFFITRIETTASSVSISKSSDYQVRLTYYNLYLKKEISTTINVKSKYENEIENFGGSVSIYYYKFFPRDVYIRNIKTPNEGIIILELLFILLMCIVFKWASAGMRRNSGMTKPAWARRR